MKKILFSLALVWCSLPAFGQANVRATPKGAELISKSTVADMQAVLGIVGTNVSTLSAAESNASTASIITSNDVVRIFDGTTSKKAKLVNGTLSFSNSVGTDWPEPTLRLERTMGAQATYYPVDLQLFCTNEYPGGLEHQNDVFLYMTAGYTNEHRRYIVWTGPAYRGDPGDRDGIGEQDWIFGVNGSDEMLAFDVQGSGHRFIMDPFDLAGTPGLTCLNSASNSPVRINWYSGASQTNGTGGLEVWSGGPANALQATIGTNGVTALPTTTNNPTFNFDGFEQAGMYYDTNLSRIGLRTASNLGLDISTSGGASIYGSLSLYGGLTFVSSGQIKIGSGSAGAPSYTFGGDTDSGFFRSSADGGYFAASFGGVEKLRINDNVVQADVPVILQSAATAPTVTGTDIALWNSNAVLYAVTASSTNALW